MNRSKLTGSDTRQELISRLAAMAADKARIARVRICIERIYEIASNCKSHQEACMNGHSSNSIAMKIRHLHNELELHVHRHCLGALYRSTSVDSLASSGTLDSDLLRQEHTIPANILAGMVYTAVSNRAASCPSELANLLLTQTIVTAVTREEDGGTLKTPRCYDGHKTPKAWTSSHPEYHRLSDFTNLSARPFLRYHGTDLKVTFWPTGYEVIPLEDTMEMHINRVKYLPMYRPETYFPSYRLAA
ncbi:hypothetical protein [Methylorubrum extorquens]|uniref:Uncharacterized protein n=1 Tax=Methylorubrum extorquens TaxID=408 RepID=A0AAX3WDF5_METEX|nr:hypothetical protein [Methylorubrum extorquens]WHQ68630.1 hypothetical protein KEC54_19995 [Methylorubrum extorquens]